MTPVAMTIIHPWKGIGQARDRTADRCSQVLYAINRTTLALQEYVNPLTDVKILDQTKLKAFTDDKLYVTKIIISVFDRVENIVGKGEIAWEKEKLLVQAISPFPTMFSKSFFPRGVKRCHCVGMG